MRVGIEDGPTDARGALDVRVVDALDGAALPGAQVAWTAPRGRGAATAGPDGRLRWDDVPAGMVRVTLTDAPSAAMPEDGDTSATVQVPEAGTAEVVFRAVRDRRVELVVFDVTTSFLAGVKLHVDRVGVGPLVTNERGRVPYLARVGDVVTVDAGELELTVEHLRAGRARIRVPGPVAGTPNDDDEAVQRIRGRVIRGTTGEAVEHARVTARRNERDAPLTARSDDDGRFMLRVPAERRTPMQVEARHDVFGVAATALLPGADGELVLELRDGGTLEGRVIDPAGAPVPVFRVRVGREGDGAEVTWRGAETFIDAEGAFSIDGLVPGAYTVEASTEDEAPTRERHVEVPMAGRAFVTVQLEEAGSVRGVVASADSGEPVPGARVRIEGFGGSADTRTGPNGTFHLDGLAPGRRSLMIEADGFRRRLVSALDIQPGQAAGPLDVRLTPRAGDDDPELDLVGIGAVLSSGGAGGLAVQRVIAGGGAAQSGIAPGDVILEVDGRSVEDLGFDGAVQALRGREGTAVQLRVRRDGATRAVTVTRSPVSV